jgi:hypothetical protein
MTSRASERDSTQARLLSRELYWKIPRAGPAGRLDTGGLVSRRDRGIQQRESLPHVERARSRALQVVTRPAMTKSRTFGGLFRKSRGCSGVHASGRRGIRLRLGLSGHVSTSGQAPSQGYAQKQFLQHGTYLRIIACRDSANSWWTRGPPPSTPAGDPTRVETAATINGRGTPDRREPLAGIPAADPREARPTPLPSSASTPASAPAACAPARARSG